MESLVLNEDEVKLTYTDSGAPQGLSDALPYTTVFAVHGMGYNAGVWKRISELSATVNLRIVAINRRPYGGSTPFSPEELSLLAGSDDEKLKFITNRGVEIATFIDQFIQRFNIPPIPADGKGGGAAILPWSAGHGSVISALSNLNNLHEDTRARFASHIRALIMYEPPSIVLGTPIPAATWSPRTDPSIPDNMKAPMISSWLTSYFDHGDLSTRNRDDLSYIVPSTLRVPTIYHMSSNEIASIVDHDGGALDGRILRAASPHALNLYHRACFDAEARAMVPNMRIRLSGGNANFVVRATRISEPRVNLDGSTPEKDLLRAHGSVVLKQAPPYFAKFPEVAFSQRRQNVEATALAYFESQEPLRDVLHAHSSIQVPSLLHHDRSQHVIIQSDVGTYPTLDTFLSSPTTTEANASTAGHALGSFLAGLHHAYDDPSSQPDLLRVFLNEDAEHVIQGVIKSATKYMKDAGVGDWDVLGPKALAHWKDRRKTAFSQGDIWFGTILVDGEAAHDAPMLKICDWEFAGLNERAADIAQLGE
ncbi:kinase-like domain-containing protein [Amylostereum chailletii]|nr:kinase-like domain-containing protein [Amylostereum chailletii]